MLVHQESGALLIHEKPLSKASRGSFPPTRMVAAQTFSGTSVRNKIDQLYPKEAAAEETAEAESAPEPHAWSQAKVCLGVWKIDDPRYGSTESN